MTIYALSSGPGISGIAVIRVSGINTSKVIKKLTGSQLPSPRVATLKKFNKNGDKELIDEFHRHSFEIGVETNGTILAPENIDWICVSPKANSTLKQITGNEIKLVYPQIEKSASPHLFQDMNFDFFFLQPLDDKNAKLNTELSIDYCLKNPQWRLSIQSHKILGLP